ncbi:Papilin [Gryllus bimaculatus]|nr:Papilin [Gryllus bimaculatus]
MSEAKVGEGSMTVGKMVEKIVGKEVATAEILNSPSVPACDILQLRASETTPEPATGDGTCERARPPPATTAPRAPPPTTYLPAGQLRGLDGAGAAGAGGRGGRPPATGGPGRAQRVLALRAAAESPFQDWRMPQFKKDGISFCIDYSATCTGGKKRYFSCNIQDCPESSMDFREEQCAAFNNIPFEGRYYHWVPYTKAPNKCELNCMPQGDRFYYRHKERVQDGTRCDEEKLDICVEGQCLPVGCDMMLGSSAKEDKCRECRGDGSSCRTIQGILEMDDLKVGYNDILLIPAGATNIKVEEVKASNNYLAIRNVSNYYYLNGNWRIDIPRSLKIAGTVFHYERKPYAFLAPETITALGPTTEPLYIVFLVQEPNPGVSYEYSIHKGTQQTDPDSYAWIYDDFTDCTTTCGGGFRTRNVTCVRRKDLEVQPSNLCNPILEPKRNESCNTDPCPPTWAEGEWGECSQSCGEGGSHTRQVHCEQIVSSGVSSIVDDEKCVDLYGPKPAITKECGLLDACPLWHIGPWKPCDRLCGDGKQRRRVRCYRKVEGKIDVLADSACPGEKPEEEKSCTLRPCEGVDWVFSDWSECEGKCGLAFKTRKVYCANEAGKIYANEFCHSKTLPETKMPCDTFIPCEHEWFASQWSECSAECGIGIKTRKVFCGSFEDDIVKKVEDDKCDPSKKYESQTNCTGKDECTGQWHYGPWSSCSKKCGGGSMSRKVFCFIDNDKVEEKKCDPSLFPFLSTSCNNHACSEDEMVPVEPTHVVDDDEYDEYDEYDCDLSTVVIDSALGKDGVTESSIAEGSGDEESSSSLADEISSIGASGSTDSWSQRKSSSVLDSLSSVSDIDSSDIISKAASDFSFGTSDDIMLSDGTGYFSDSPSTSFFTAEGSGDATSEDTTDFSDHTSPTELPSEASSSFSESDETPEAETTTESGISESASTTDSGLLSTTDSLLSSITSTVLNTFASAFTETPEVSSVGKASDETDSHLSSDVTTPSSEIPTTETASEISTDSTSSPATEETVSTPSSESTTDPSSTEKTTDATVSELTTAAPDEDDLGEVRLPVVTTKAPTEEVSTSMSSSAEDKTITTTEESTTSGSEETTTPEGSESTTSTLELTSDTSEPTSISTSAYSTESSSVFTSEQSTESSTIESTMEDSETTLTSDVTTESTDISTVSPSEFSTESTTEIANDTEETTVTAEETTVTAEESTVTTEETTSEMSSGYSSTMEIFVTTPSSIQVAITKEQKVKKCRRKKKPKAKKPTCETSEFGCCPDSISAASGPFSKGCVQVETCNETKYKCCPDGVSAATGPNGEGCPSSHCEETLFGCCPDGISIAEGNDYEGCVDVPFDCQNTQFGCCPDNLTPATGPNNEGCFECEGSGECQFCNDTKYGCCPDGVSAAKGPDFSGCKEGTEYFIGTTEVSDCKASEYGCCPDGINEATGPHSEGCDIVINHENCSASYFGCCKDGISAALGPNLEGCEISICESELYGCCDDNKTPAHGPNKEGCCLNTQYGCCPDNILSAQGPNLEGCGCQYTPYGCCPDNTTAARGANSEGCGCRFTEHGCCPNQYTPAAGPNFEGCPCHTHQFGCCPDGITIARGPRNYGCGCENTEFGCCSDGKTPATGPELAGCDCAASKYGCCIDGTTSAEGEKFEGCEDAPIVAADACTQPRERGPCRDFTVKWFFDIEYGGCARFWYGGCGGNDNRFKTQEECKNKCVEPSGRAQFMSCNLVPTDACYLPKIEGPCEGYYPTWYYDTERKHCGQFIYGGCLGNNNKFETREECEELCVKPDIIDACEQPKLEGPCEGNFSRWYYDQDTKTCQRFIYGGCKGNANNFVSELACHQQCLKPGRSRDYCTLPRAQGTCMEHLPRWFFDASEQRCMPFYYSGCEGNANRFETREACERDCPPTIEQDICALPAVIGSCHNYTERWYYNTYDVRCSPFYYGGCDGNENNFLTMQDCQQRCENMPTPPPEQEFRRDICQLPRVVGPCNGNYRQWYYEKATGECLEFDYGGCQGNGNRFDDKRQCEEYCRRAPPVDFILSTQAPAINEVEPTDICSAPVDQGPCRAAFTNWYFNEAKRQCEAFIYGGCGGNANRFESEEQCERQCGEFKGQDVCNIPYEVGPCESKYQKWHFDQESRRCQSFEYGGCYGNGNRFSSIEECESVCFRREEILPPGNDTVQTNKAICKQPVDSGPCPRGHYKRWYFDEERRTCIPFIYTGCGGNLNRFKNFQYCLSFCSVLIQETTVSESSYGEVPDHCKEATDRCKHLHCPYGVTRSVDSNNCEVCYCFEPCDGIVCPEGTSCGIDLYRDPDTSETAFRPTCRYTSKEGHCPEQVSVPGNCSDECKSDADCSEDFKCCFNGCGSSCVSPAITVTPSRPAKPPPTVGEPPYIQETDSIVTAEEANYVTLKCDAFGNPPPSVTWSKGAVQAPDQVQK